jgi:hypothetical protein
MGEGVGAIYALLDMEADHGASTDPCRMMGWMPWANPGPQTPSAS